jgi:hypothetical protein
MAAVSRRLREKFRSQENRTMLKALVSFAVLLLASTFAAAQSTETVCEVHINKVKPGMTAQYEQGRAKHMAWHKAQKDAWSWNTYAITTGENTGAYLISSCGHPWKDFDGREKFNQADSANANSTMGAYLQAEMMSYYVLRQELSAELKPGPPPAYFSVTSFHLKPEGAVEFREGMKQINEAFKKTNEPRAPWYWYSLANGGPGPEMVLVSERKSLADMAPPSPKTLDDIMKDAFGDQGTTTLTNIRKSFYQTNSELLQYRADLSYEPAAAK